jgi:hypothetical protein
MMGEMIEVGDGRLDAEGATRLSFVYVEDKQI